MAEDREFVDIAREFLILVGRDLDSYVSEKSSVEVSGPTKVTLFTASHIQFAKYGRGPGKKPPLDAILEFVKKKGIIFEDTDARGTAFAIQLSISKKGTKNWVPNAPDALQEAVNKQLNKYYDKVEVANTEKTNQEIKEIFDKQFPLTIKFKA